MDHLVVVIYFFCLRKGRALGGVFFILLERATRNEGGGRVGYDEE